MRARYLLFDRTFTPRHPTSQLEPRPSGPAEALVDWLQARPPVLACCRILCEPQCQPDKCGQHTRVTRVRGSEAGRCARVLELP